MRTCRRPRSTDTPRTSTQSCTTEVYAPDGGAGKGYGALVPGTVREASGADAAACAALYRPYVLGTAITFEVEPPTAEQMAERIAAAQRAHAWVVLEDAGEVVGYAYGGPWGTRAAYRWSCEVSIYLEQGRRRTGSGRALYGALFPRLVERGLCTAVAGMTLPNPASEALHRAMGFEPVGTYRRVGWKHDAWHDVLWMQRPLAPQDGPPDRDPSPGPLDRAPRSRPAAP